MKDRDNNNNNNNNNTNNRDSQKEIDDFFAQFENIHDEFDKISDNFNTADSKEHHKNTIDDNLSSGLNDGQDRTNEKTRIFRSEKFKNPLEQEVDRASSPFSKISGGVSSFATKIKNKFYIDKAGDNPQMASSKNRRTKRYKFNVKKLLKTLLIIIAALALAMGVYVISIVLSSPSIDPDNIYSMLSESSVLYDDKGEPVESVFEKEGKRVNMEYSDMPRNLVNAFVALEDKTFWKHNGFNFVRIFGAIRDSFTSGKISGTSTITQQLARNVYISDAKSERTISRKVREAYYTMRLESKLTKKQILEAYLNTIFLGYNSYGVQSASISYFGKDVTELDLFEAAALAALAQLPDRYALIKTLNTESISEETEGILYKGSQYTYVASDNSKNRRELCLALMQKQGMIDKESYDLAVQDSLLAHLNPGLDEKSELSTYFTDYVIGEVIKDLEKDFHLDYNDARRMLYTNGLSVYTTMDSAMQFIVESEFSKSENFPKVANLKRDGQGNILGNNNKIVLYNSLTYFNEDGSFTLLPDEYKVNEDGSLSILKGKRLNIFNITVQGNPDHSLEFKPLYKIVDSVFYSINGGNIGISSQYKSRDSDGNLIISADFFSDNPDFLAFEDRGLTLYPDAYTLAQDVVQPQAAMVLTEYESGQIKALVGGRSTKGRMLFNRATSPRQPGSAIKPLSVYSSALQQAYEAQAAGTNQYFVTLDNYGNEIPNYYGDYWTVASVIDDAPLKTGDKVWPKNWYNSYRGLMSLRYAVEQSVNVAAVKVVSQVGFDYAADILEKFGVTSVERKDLVVNDLNPAALGLGGMTYGISPLEMVGGFGAIANSGKYVEPICYTHIENKRGEVILSKTSRTNQVIDQSAAFIMSDILRSVVTNGLGSPASIPNHPVAGKTGTTTDNYDAWFVGYTPKYAASLWIGNDTSIELSQGSTSAARLWSKIMRQCLAGTPADSFPGPPDNIVIATVDAYSGGLPNGGTTKSEYFIKGTVPSRVIKIYSRVAICTDSGYLATPWCNTVIYKTGTDRGYEVDHPGATTHEVPSYYCPYHNLDLKNFPIDPSGQTQYEFEEIETEDPMEPGKPEEPIDPVPEKPDGDVKDGENGNENGNGNGNGNEDNSSDGIPGWLL